MREELAKMIQERTGLDEAMAQQVTTVVLDYLKTRLPPEVASMLEGGMPAGGDVGGLLGGLFGRRSE